MLEHARKKPLFGALSLIQHCLKPDANNRATTKDILRHKWLAHGPVLSIQFNSTTSSALSLTDQKISNNYDTNRLRPSQLLATSTATIENSISPTNSLVELELHTSSFFDSTRLRDNSSVNKEQQRRNRVSAIPISTRYLSSNNTKTDSSLLSRPTYRRPVSLSLDDQHSTNEKLQRQSVDNRNSHQTVSSSSAATTTTTYDNNDRYHSLQTTHPLTLPLSSESSTTITTPSSFLISNDFDLTLNDLKCKTIYKYTSPAKTEYNATPHFQNSTTAVAPSVFTTSAIKFAPVPTRRISPLKDQENNSSKSTARLLNNTTSNPSYNNDDSINIASTTTTNNNNNNSEQLLTTLELSTPYNIHKHRLLDDNNNLVSLKVYE